MLYHINKLVPQGWHSRHHFTFPSVQAMELGADLLSQVILTSFRHGSLIFNKPVCDSVKKQNKSLRTTCIGPCPNHQ